MPVSSDACLSSSSFKSAQIEGAQFVGCTFEYCEIFQDFDESELSIEAEFKDCKFNHSNVVGQG